MRRIKKKRRALEVSTEQISADIPDDSHVTLTNATVSSVEALRQALWLKKRHDLELLDETLQKFYDFLRKYFAKEL